MKRTSIIAGALTAILCACSGAPSGTVPGTPGYVPSMQNGGNVLLLPSATGSTMVEIRLAIPSKTAAALKADYVSPNTASVKIKEGKATLGTFDTVKGKACKKTSGGGLNCTFLMTATAGKNQKFTVDTYDQKKGKGAVLSDASFTQTIVANKTNVLKLTLVGVISTITVSLSDYSPIIGHTSTIDVILFARDASGATIVGSQKYVPPITLVDEDTSGHTHLSGTKVAAPSTKITLAYDGSSSLTSATISATAKGIKAANITPATMTPSTVAAVTVSGTAAFSVVSDASGNVAAIIPSAVGVTTVQVAYHGHIGGSGTGAAVRPHASGLTLRPIPDECAPDLQHAQLYCMSFGSNVVSIVGLNLSNVLASPTLVGQIHTDAPCPKGYSSANPGCDVAGSGVAFSGATCAICGIAYDPTDQAFIISTANGYELYATTPQTKKPAPPLATIHAPVSENFGYNAVTNSIFSGWYSYTAETFDSLGAYQGLDLINVDAGNRYAIATYPSPNPGVGSCCSEPDAAAVDTKTNIGIAPEENSFPVYMVDFSTAILTPPSGTPYPVGSYTANAASITPGSTLTSSCDETYTAVDSQLDLGFFGSEFCGNDYIAVAQMPTASGGTLGFSSYVAAQMPNTPAGTFVSPYDPHAVLVVNIPSICPDCGLLFNYDKSYLAVVDLPSLLALGGGAAEYDVPTTNTLSGIVTYIATGISDPPALRFKRQAEFQRHARMHPR